MTKTKFTIRGGLRRLEFQPQSSDTAGSNASHVIVEFVTTKALTADQIVQINLGIREGVARTLSGAPTLMTAAGGRIKNEFRYIGSKATSVKNAREPRSQRGTSANSTVPPLQRSPEQATAGTVA